MTPRGRFAPSPTGRLHLGNARSALLGWLDLRSRGGEFLLRIEDLDPERSRVDGAAGVREDLAWLGLDFDGPVWRQSERGPAYLDALQHLEAAGRVYPCWCSRAEVARAASAPHPGEEGPIYPGTCRRTPAPRPGRSPALRFAARPGPTRLVDRLHGPVEQDVAAEVGDFVVRRADGVASYQLAVVVDDAASGVTDVLRGDDLLASTPRQLQLLEALGLPAPRYAHVPLLVEPDGRRLAKREGALTVAALREAGARPEAVVGALAALSGLGDGRPVAARELVAGFRLEAIARTPGVVDLARLMGALGVR
jgi:glutamyl-tRNA synthetase